MITMNGQKPLPPATWEALSPPAGPAFPYTFFEHAGEHPFDARDTAFALRNAWWLGDAAFLAYSTASTIAAVWKGVSDRIEVKNFSGESTQCYVADGPEWIVLAWRGTQVDDFWASTLDWLTDARFFPRADAHGDLVHWGFLDAIGEVWGEVREHVESLQRREPRPLWITGHSLGAALATIASNLCHDRPGLGLAGTYTYASPRVGDAGFCRVIETPVYRFQNNSDLVTHLPIGLVYDHVGTREFIDAGGHLHRDLAMPNWLLPFDPDALRTLCRRAAGGMRPGAMPGVLADHAPINYATLIWNCYDRARSATGIAG